MTRTRWAIAGALLAIALLAASFYGGWWAHRARTGEERRLAQGQVREVTAQYRAALAARALEDSVRMVADRAVIARQDSIIRKHANRVTVLGSALTVMRDQAKTASDSAAMVPVLELALEASEATVALLSESRVTAETQRDSAYAATARLRGTVARQLVTMDSLLAVATTKPVPVIPSAGRKLLKGAETIAIGMVTVKACEASLVSVSCAAGVLVTANRLRP